MTEPEPLKTFPTKYRAYFANWGHKTFDSYEEAVNAAPDARGEVQRVDKLTQETLWLRDADNAYPDSGE